MSWLASKHGTDAVGNADGVLDGTARLAIYSGGFAKAATILAKNSSTGRYVPFDNAGSNGTNTAVGTLLRFKGSWQHRLVGATVDGH
jgi:hypothetical protein